jgi:hypothetical protein
MMISWPTVKSVHKLGELFVFFFDFHALRIRVMLKYASTTIFPRMCMVAIIEVCFA